MPKHAVAVRRDADQLRWRGLLGAGRGRGGEGNDAVAFNSPAIQGQIRSSPDTFLELPFVVAVPKGKRAELLACLNTGIASIRADGTWHQINERWRRE